MAAYVPAGWVTEKGASWWRKKLQAAHEQSKGLNVNACETAYMRALATVSQFYGTTYFECVRKLF